MKILVCGGREFGNLVGLKREHPDYPEKEKEFMFVMTKLGELAAKYSPSQDPFQDWDPDGLEIITGGASGVDSIATQWAEANGVTNRVYKADWSKNKKSAGPIRNRKMYDTEKPDMVVSFPGGAGTSDMVKYTAERQKKGDKVQFIGFNYVR